MIDRSGQAVRWTIVLSVRMVMMVMVIMAVMVVMAVPGPRAWAQGGGRPPAPVGVDEARIESIQPKRLVTGEVRASRRSRVATRESGLVEACPVDEGQFVQVDELVARLDSRRLDILIRENTADSRVASAVLEERQVQQDQAESDLSVIMTSFEAGAANAKEVRDAEHDVAVARSRQIQGTREVELIAARAELLQQRLDDTRITAPFDGVIVMRHTEAGEWLGEGDVVVEIIDVGTVEIWLNVPQRHMGSVMNSAEPITVEIDAAARTISAEERRVIPLVDKKARSFTVVATVDNGDSTLAPGMSVKAWIPTAGLEERITVARDAILQNDTGPYVFVARPGPGGGPSVATLVPVELQFPVDERVVVRAPDLRPGDLVVVEGNERLYPMMPIAPLTESAGGGGERP